MSLESIISDNTLAARALTDALVRVATLLAAGASPSPAPIALPADAGERAIAKAVSIAAEGGGPAGVVSVAVGDGAATVAKLPPLPGATIAPLATTTAAAPVAQTVVVDTPPVAATLEAVKSAVLALVKAKGEPVAVKLLAHYGVKNANHLKPEQYATVLDSLNLAAM